MTLQTWLVFIGTVAVLTASPGPNALLALSHGVKFGFRRTFSTICGSISAFILLMVASLAGLGAIMASSVWLFETVRWLGAAYLVFMGVKIWVSSPKDVAEIQFGAEGKSKIDLFKNGFLIAAGNPKVIIFFASFFPQFINPDHSQVAQMLILGLTFVVLELTWQLIYARSGNKLSAWVKSPKRRKVVDKISGSFFITAGMVLAFVQKQ